jgi:hypothetical protein
MFQFEEDGYDLLIMFMEFLIAKKNNFVDTFPATILKHSPVIFKDKVWICGVKSCLSKNKRKVKILVNLEFSGRPESMELLKRTLKNSESILELSPEENLKAGLTFKCEELRFWGSPIDYFFEI